MTDHINRSLLAFAAAYLFLLPTNGVTFLVSVTFVGGALLALASYAIAWRDPATRVPSAGAPILVPLVVWALWACASLAWSVDLHYSEGQLAREVMDSVVAMFVFYVAARDATSLRVLMGAALASFTFFALLAIGMLAVNGTWDSGRWHHGVGAWSTWSVLIAPFLFALLAPKPAGVGGGARPLAVGVMLLVLLFVTVRMTDNRVAWLALAAVFAVASLVAVLRWPHTFTRTPRRWLAPLAVLLVVLGLAFADALEERAALVREGGVAQSLERDPRLVLWEYVTERIAARPFLGYGFGRRILAGDLTAETGNPLLAHAHDLFASQWLQTGLVGMLAFTAFLGAIAFRYVRFVRSRDDTLAFVGVVGVALVIGFVAKNLTDDFLFRSNAKELWAMTFFLLGYGVRRERMLAQSECALARERGGTPSGDASPAAAPQPSRRSSQRESA